MPASPQPTLKRAAIIFFILFIAQAAQAASQVEFFIGDRVDPTRKWGHVSLRVYEDDPLIEGDEKDLIFDFGRYARMWNKDIEGDPILRVWENSVDAYIRYHKKDGGTTKRYTFESTPERNAMILAYYQDAVDRGRRHASDDHWTSWELGTRAFHAVDFNCTTIAIAAFMQGFPEYNLNVKAYSKARTLNFFLRNYAKQAGGYSSSSERWSIIWWPLDLRAVLEERYAAKSLAAVESYHY